MNDDYKEGLREGRDDYLSKTRPYLPAYTGVEADHSAEFLRGYAAGWAEAPNSPPKRKRQLNVA